MGLKKLDGQSENITEEQKAKLKELFPEVFHESHRVVTQYDVGVKIEGDI